MLSVFLAQWNCCLCLFGLGLTKELFVDCFTFITFFWWFYVCLVEKACLAIAIVALTAFELCC